MRRLRPVLRKVAKWSIAAGAAAVVLLGMPVAWIEIACRSDSNAAPYASVIGDSSLQRREANTYLTYPEWHIVYAYDGLAEALKTGDEHAFDYVSSVTGFWRAACVLMRTADGHGGADGSTRSMIHTIGVSFTLEMGLKAIYEETLGRAAAWVRGPAKTPQDKAIADMATDYAAFLRQTPWYQYPFVRETGTLWAAPIDSVVRGWERRLSIGAEFLTKAAYAKILAGAVAATGQAPLSIRTIVAGLDRAELTSIPAVTVVGKRGGRFEIETPRYDLFTRILGSIAHKGGTIVEIAGNDDIMVSVTTPQGASGEVSPGTLLARMPRSGFDGERLLVDLKVKDLARFLATHPPGDPGVEHVYDY